jgi:hypothetical protein
VAPGCPSRAARSGWCYGDPGLAAALLLAAASVPDAWWKREAMAIALAAAARPAGGAGVVDASLCHGAAGLGHLYNRMFQATGEPALAAASGFWFQETLRTRRPGDGIAGFQPYHPPDGPPPNLPDRAGFLMGAAGIGLALLAACSPVEPEWDRVLLTSLPCSGRT